MNERKEWAKRGKIASIVFLISAVFVIGGATKSTSILESISGIILVVGVVLNAVALHKIDPQRNMVTTVLLLVLTNYIYIIYLLIAVYPPILKEPD